MCFSAFGGNGLLICPEMLMKEKLLDATDISKSPAFPLQRVDYGQVILLRIDAKAFSSIMSHEQYRCTQQNPMSPDVNDAERRKSAAHQAGVTLPPQAL